LSRIFTNAALLRIFRKCATKLHLTPDCYGRPIYNHLQFYIGDADTALPAVDALQGAALKMTQHQKWDYSITPENFCAKFCTLFRHGPVH